METNVRHAGWLIVITQFVLIGLILVSAYYESITIRRVSILAVEVLSFCFIVTGTGGLIISIFTFGQKITPFPELGSKARLVRAGIYSVIRHPMYFFTTVFMIGYTIFFNAYYTLILCVLLVWFFDYKIRKEERYLMERFPEYAGYSKATRKLVPFIY